VALLTGSTQNDGTLFTIGENNLTNFLSTFQNRVPGGVSPDFVRSLYPGMNDTDVIEDAFRDVFFLW
jgi:hypothetical protein